MTQFDESKLSRIIARRIIAPEDRSQLLPLCTPVFCPDNRGVKASKVTIIDPNLNTFYDGDYGITIGSEIEHVDANEDTGTPAYDRTKTAPSVIKNLIDIELNQKVEESYFVPYEIDLETNVDLINVIKSDYAVKFKKAVSNRILTTLVAMKTAGTIPTINMGSSLAEAFGDVLCEFVANGTGQKYSIYRYNNGAPVVYDITSTQPNIDKEIIDPLPTYAGKDDIDVPALHYYEKPSLILPATQYKDFQTQMCSGGLREYVVNKVAVDTADINWSTLGEGIFGTNDSFAVAFTQPAIKLIPDQDFFGYRLCCTIYYGIQLIHKDNLRLFT